MNKIYFFLIIFSFLKFAYFTLHASDLNLKESIENSYRAENNILRDKYRNPYETLTFSELIKIKKFWKFLLKWILHRNNFTLYERYRKLLCNRI